MKNPLPKEVERYRIRTGTRGSDESYGNNGAFLIPNKLRSGKKKWKQNGFTSVFTVVISDGADWEHVSVSFQTRCPWWDEMCYIKDMFFEPDECVLQFHPPTSKYINFHPYCLHLWKPIGKEIDIPAGYLVGPGG